MQNKSRSKLIEDLSDNNQIGELENCLVLFITVEKRDEDNTDLISHALIEIEKVTSQLKITNIVILSFAHLFGKLSTPEYSFNSLKDLEMNLKEKGYNTLRPPFGWFNEIELKAKGHPLSRISRIID